MSRDKVSIVDCGSAFNFTKSFYDDIGLAA